ncbi:MAG: nucleotide-binding protein [Phycisphaerales bacterium]|jgi:predicted nucleotide-binding protein
MNPRIFVGSSLEGEEIAAAIQENLERYDFQVTVWEQDIFELSENTLDSLIKALERFDFGVFVFSPVICPLVLVQPS